MLRLDHTSDYQVTRFESPTGRNWLTGSTTDTWVVVNGKPEPFGRRDVGFELERVQTFNTGGTLRLDAIYRYRPANVRIARHIVVADGSPTFELWTSFEALGPEADLSDLNGFELTVPAGALRWLTGLREEGRADGQYLPAFSRQSRLLDPGSGLALGAQARSSEDAIPWFAIDGDDDELYAGLLWSGAWSLQAYRNDDALSLSFGLTGMTTHLDQRVVEAPHVLLGAVRGGLDQAAIGLRSYLVPGLRGGRDFSPLVTFNTWFVNGTRIDDRRIRAEMDRVALLGVELFVLDAGWYAGAGAEGIFDFSSGLGRWQPDPDRFPDGLGGLADHAHELGMKFGIWVEPERVDLDVLEEAGIDQSWLGTSGGQHLTERTGQICLAGAEGQRWVWDRLTSFIDQVHPDYLKWDNNGWLNCDRDGHGHGASDGNYAHVRGLYELLSLLRDSYPNLLVENVSGGGNRLDYGMLRYSDVGWMDDRSGRASHVRHNFEGLSAAFPPGYLFAFVTEQDEAEQLTTHHDLALYFRSRMLGVLGLSFSLEGLVTLDAIEREIQTYKGLRDILKDGAGLLLSDQAQVKGGPLWDVFQVETPNGNHVLLFAFQNDSASGVLTLRPTALDPEGIYGVQSVDFGDLGEAKGGDLVQDGIDVYPLERTGAHVLVLTRTN